MAVQFLKFNQERGMTLVELVVVAALILVLVGVLVPLSDRLVAKNELQAAARTIVGYVRLGESKALAEEDASFKMRFFPSRNSYRLYFNSRDIRESGEIVLPKRVSFGGTNFDDDTLRFNARGTVTQGGTISLHDKYGDWLYVRVQPVTGRVVID